MLMSNLRRLPASWAFSKATVTPGARTWTNRSPLATWIRCAESSNCTGIEPDIALVKYKLLAGGGLLKIVNQTVPEGLRRLGYTAQDNERIIAHIARFDTIEDVEEGGQTVRSPLKSE